MGVRRSFVSWIGRIRLLAQGIEAGHALVLYGMPIVARCATSRIVIGDRVALCSDARCNPVGVNHPVILRTIRPDSIIEIGDDTGLSGAAVCAARAVRIGRQCLIGANVTITDCDFHAVDPRNRRYTTDPGRIGCAPVVIEDNVWLGMNVLVLKGVTIGMNSVVAAGSVVAKSLPANCLAAGTPARVVRMLDADGLTCRPAPDA